DPLGWPVTMTAYKDAALGTSERYYFGGPGWAALLADMGFEVGNGGGGGGGGVEGWPSPPCWLPGGGLPGGRRRGGSTLPRPRGGPHVRSVRVAGGLPDACRHAGGEGPDARARLEAGVRAGEGQARRQARGAQARRVEVPQVRVLI